MLRRRLALAMASTALTIGLLEVGGRLLLPGGPDSHPFSSDAQRGWSLPVDARFDFMGIPVQTNSLGVRGPEPGDKTGARWLALGDSSVFGHGVQDDETFPAQLEALRPELQVINGGVPGYTCAQSREQFLRLDSTVDPDGLLLYLMISDSFLPHPSDTIWLPELPLRGSGIGRIGVAGAAWLGQREGTRVPVPEFEACVRQLSQEFEGEIVFILPVMDQDLWGDPPRQLQGYRAVVRDIAEGRGVLVDLPERFIEDGRGAEVLMLDPVHPSVQGQTLIARVLAASVPGG